MSANLILPENELTVSQQPALVYLTSLPSAASRRTARKALAAVADILGVTSDQGSMRSPLVSIHWSALRSQHTEAIRARLLELYSPATARLYLSALRGVLYQAWKLGEMSSEDYRKAAGTANN